MNIKLDQDQNISSSPLLLWDPQYNTPCDQKWRRRDSQEAKTAATRDRNKTIESTDPAGCLWPVTSHEPLATAGAAGGCTADNLDRCWLDGWGKSLTDACRRS